MPPRFEEPALHKLLDLQAEDTALRRLDERRASLPEAARLAEVKGAIEELTADLEIADKQLAEINREQNRLEGEIELLEQKMAREEQRMYAGSISNPKELSALQAEVESLKRKRAGLEDELLEVMVQKDQAAATQENLSAEKSNAQTEAEGLDARVTELTKEIDAEVALHAARRSEIIPDIPEELLKLYEQIRATKGGVGVAALEAGTCQGCHTKLPSREVERMRGERGLQRCENCRRILVIT